MTASVRNHWTSLLCLTTAIFVMKCLSQELVQDNFLLVVAVYQGRRNLYQIDLNSNAMIPILTTNASGLVALAFDPVHWIAYWSDVGEGVIGKTSLRGSRRNSTIIYRSPDGTSPLDGLALDIANGKLYYADAGISPRIVEMNIDGSQPVTIRAESGMKPRALVLDTVNRHLYYTDWSDQPGIYVIDLGTRQRRTILTYNLVWPNGLAIDFEGGVMYLADASTHRIEMARLDGSGRVTLATVPNGHFFSIALSPQYLYITDWFNSAVRRLDRRTHELSNQEPSVFGSQYGIVYYNSSSFRNFSTTSSTSTPTTSTTTTQRLSTTSSTSTLTISSTTTEHSVERTTESSTIFQYPTIPNSVLITVIATCASGGAAILLVIVVVVVIIVIKKN